MLPALTALAFLATLWLIGVVVIRTVEESGARIVAALAGTRGDIQPALVLELRPQTKLELRLEPRMLAAA